jgi:hypothetical protein
MRSRKFSVGPGSSLGQDIAMAIFWGAPAVEVFAVQGRQIR